MNLPAASAYITDRLRRELDPTLRYHCVEHTLDVYEATCRLADFEGTAPNDRAILETAALWHDSGMLIQYKDHEEASATLARSILPAYGYSPADIDEVTSLILVTRLPQRPYNSLEQILCDADLDYLGRDDFWVNSFRLHLEWKLNGILDASLSEWLAIQIKFLSEHNYFTRSAQALREEKKQQHLAAIRSLCSNLNETPNP